MKSVLIGALMCVAFLAPSAAPALASPLSAPAGGTACLEDMPCFNWTKMGNRKRGVVTMWGTMKVVGCGDFRWLVRHGDLDERSTPWLVGDWSCGRRR